MRQRLKLTESQEAKIIDFKVQGLKVKLTKSSMTKVNSFKVHGLKPKWNERSMTENGTDPRKKEIEFQIYLASS